MQRLSLRVTDERPSGIWDYISPSRLNLWLKCPLAWKLRHIDGIKTPPTPALFLGTRVHDALTTAGRGRRDRKNPAVAAWIMFPVPRSTFAAAYGGAGRGTRSAGWPERLHGRALFLWISENLQTLGVASFGVRPSRPAVVLRNHA